MLGWALFALTCVVGAAALALDLDLRRYTTLVYLGVNGFLALIGVLLTTRRPEHPISWVLALIALWGTIGGLAYAYAVEALVGHPGSLPGGLAAAWVDNWWWLPGLALPLSALLLLMPDGHLVSRRWWPVPVVMVVGGRLAAAPDGLGPQALHVALPACGRKSRRRPRARSTSSAPTPGTLYTAVESAPACARLPRMVPVTT